MLVLPSIFLVLPLRSEVRSRREQRRPRHRDRPCEAGRRCVLRAKWRDRDGRQVKRRVGRAWVERDGASGWRKRRGRTPVGWYDERTVHVAAAELVERIEHERAEAAKAAAQAEAVTFRRVAHEWLAWRRDVKGGAPSTLRDNEALLREPGTRFKRGTAVSPGRIMKRFGAMPPETITTRDVSEFLRELDGAGIAPKTVNKYRELLHAIFNYAMRSEPAPSHAARGKWSGPLSSECPRSTRWRLATG